MYITSTKKFTAWRMSCLKEWSSILFNYLHCIKLRITSSLYQIMYGWNCLFRYKLIPLISFGFFTVSHHHCIIEKTKMHIYTSTYPHSLSCERVIRENCAEWKFKKWKDSGIVTNRPFLFRVSLVFMIYSLFFFKDARIILWFYVHELYAGTTYYQSGQCSNYFKSN